MNICNGIDGGFTPTGGRLLVRERRAAAKARSAQGAAQFAAGPALHANSGPASEDALVP